MSGEKFKGSCLCGDVSYQLSGPTKVFQHCHCTRCQNMTGLCIISTIQIKPFGMKRLPL